MSKTASKQLYTDMAAEALFEALLSTTDGASDSRPLWIADEQKLPSNLIAGLTQHNGLFISNRFDQYQYASNGGVQSWFSDMNLDALPANSIGHIFFRVAKERALVHHLINQATRTLPIGGALWLSGFKNEGIKTHIQRAQDRFDAKADITRHKKQLYLAKIIRKDSQTSDLPDDNYPVLRQIECGQQLIWTKPGLFGWNKEDQASKLLMDWLSGTPTLIKSKKVLDLGCGYGYLCLRAAALGSAEVVATDNCAAALDACKKNLSDKQIQTEVIQSHAGCGINGSFDAILCNPPFHQGFSTTSDLHQLFVKETKRLLASDGKAWYVVNQFLNIGDIAEKSGLSCTEAHRTKSYKILELKHR